MELHNTFSVPIPVDEAWKVLTDVERIAPCLPGAQLQEIDGDEYRGIVKVKVGPITAQYKGKATFVEKDDQGHKAVLRAEGRDTRGQGNANATITMTMAGTGAKTDVTVDTDLNITGRVAQFGRGVLADVSEKLLGQFVDCLENKIAAGDDAGAAAEPGAPAAPAAPPKADAPVGTGAGTAGEVVQPAPAAVPQQDDDKQNDDKSTDHKPTTEKTTAEKTTAAPDRELQTNATPDEAARSGTGTAGGAAAAMAAKQETDPALTGDAVRTPPADEERETRPESRSAVRTINHPEPEPIDVLDHTPDYVKLGTAGIGALLVAIILFLLLRRKSS